jgi:hypothetical protein
MKDIESMLQVINKINVKMHQSFSVRFIQFKQKLNAISIKVKVF